MRKVKLPTGKERAVADNQIPVDLYCPIDGTQLAERFEYDFTAYDCVTCNQSYSIRRGTISQDELKKYAQNILNRVRKELDKIDKERSELIRVLELAEHNKFS